MKKISFLLFASIIVFCQFAVAGKGIFGKDERLTTFRPPREWKGNVQYQEVIYARDAKASALLSNAKEWCARTFAAVPGALQSEDSAAGLLSYKGSIKAARSNGSAVEEPTVWFILTVEAIDGRSRVTFSAFSVDGSMPAGSGAQERKIFPMEECLNEQGFPDDRDTEKFLLNVNDQIKVMMKDISKALSGGEAIPAK